MSTSDGHPASLSGIETDVVDSPESPASLPGFPSTAELTRMASEMFAAMSGMRVDGALVTPPVGGPSSASGAPMPVATMPTESALRSAPALAEGLSAPPPVGSPPAALAVPSLGYDAREAGREMADAAAMLAEDPEIVRTMITHRYPLEDAFYKMEAVESV